MVAFCGQLCHVTLERLLKSTLVSRILFGARGAAHIPQAIFQTYKYIIVCTTAEYVRVSQRFVEPSPLLHDLGTDGPKVSDVFHTGSPESPLWEFKHGNGNFKRGDLVGLREIKRRASRHALVHRDSYSAPKAPLSQPGTPAEPIHGMQESTETRLTNVEHTLYDMHARLQRSEDNSHLLHVRNQVVMEALSRSLQLNHEMARVLLSLTPNPDTPLHRDGRCAEILFSTHANSRN